MRFGRNFSIFPGIIYLPHRTGWLISKWLAIFKICILPPLIAHELDTVGPTALDDVPHSGCAPWRLGTLAGCHGNGAAGDQVCGLAADSTFWLVLPAMSTLTLAHAAGWSS